MSVRVKILFLLLLSVLSAYGSSVRLTVDLGRGHSSIGVGDLFYINVDVTDINEKPSTPASVPGAKVMYFDRVSTSSSYTSTNGVVSQTSSSRYVLTVKATKEGKYTFGPISVGGVKSNSVSYTISKEGESHPGSSSSGGAADSDNRSDSGNAGVNDKDDGKPKFIGKGDSNLFLKASVSQTSVYEQQALVYTVKLYTTYDAIKFIGATAAPKFDGFVVEESKDISHSLTPENYNGKVYATAVIARYVIFPQMPGSLKVTGNTYTVSVDQREYYHDPFWGNMSYSTPLQLNVTPNDLTVEVKALPVPKPADFSGGVGSFKISSELKSKNLKSNTAGSIVYTVSGTGNLKYIQLPDLNSIYPDELEVYSPKTDVKAQVGSSNVSGTVTFDYSFMPLEEGMFQIPPVKFTFFNPETGKYETSQAKGYTVDVAKGEGSSKSFINKQRRLDSSLKKVKIENLKKKESPLLYTFAFWLFFLIPTFLLVIVVVILRVYAKQHADMAAFKSKRADKIARKRLRKAYNCLRKNDADHFYEELLSALWGYVGDKLKMPTSELMRDNIRSVLESKGIEENIINGFIELLDVCEFARYSPEGGKAGMKDAYDSSVKEINEMENAFKNKK